MKILIDINHPAHVHYFKNTIKVLSQRKHKISIVARDRYPTLTLLKSYGFEYLNRGTGSSSFLGKILYLLKANLIFLKLMRNYKPDLVISFSTPYSHLVAKLLGIPNIAFTDTERAYMHKYLTFPFVDYILTPSCYKENLGEKHIYFNGFMELSYLHTNYFSPNEKIYNLLNLDYGERYAIVRFVSWEAHHDLGERGFSTAAKMQLIELLKQYMKVYISSESALPKELEDYKLTIPPERMHDVLAFASLYVGESPTMTTESAILGTPGICVSSWACDCGNFSELENYKLIKCFHPKDELKALEMLENVLVNDKTGFLFKKRSEKMLADKIDVTAFMVWFVENYPESVKIMQENPDYQYRFK